MYVIRDPYLRFNPQVSPATSDAHTNISSQILTQNKRGHHFTTMLLYTAVQRSL